MGADNLLNRPDFMAAEKFFYLLSGLCALTDKTVIIPTNFPGHHSLKSVASKDPGIFYSQELKFRKQLKFPPYRNFALVKVRGRDAEKAKKAAEDLFSRLKDGKEVKAVSLNPADPEKLRGNFYWQVLLSASSVLKLNKFLKIHLKNLRYSGIIVTIDVDPV
jgi:primosomal protein N' (replication factor Y)